MGGRAGANTLLSAATSRRCGMRARYAQAVGGACYNAARLQLRAPTQPIDYADDAQVTVWPGLSNACGGTPDHPGAGSFLHDPRTRPSYRRNSTALMITSTGDTGNTAV
ncbi:MAG: hypothetical protein R3D30_03615 [Hyphomicrobiales bacterium]